MPQSSFCLKFEWVYTDIIDCVVIWCSFHRLFLTTVRWLDTHFVEFSLMRLRVRWLLIDCTQTFLGCRRSDTVSVVFFSIMSADSIKWPTIFHWLDPLVTYFFNICVSLHTKSFAFGHIAEILARHFLIPSRIPCGPHFGVILETLDSLLGPRDAFGEVLEGYENEVEIGEPPKSCLGCVREGCPLEDESPRTRRIQIRIMIRMENVTAFGSGTRHAATYLRYGGGF